MATELNNTTTEDPTLEQDPSKGTPPESITPVEKQTAPEQPSNDTLKQFHQQLLGVQSGSQMDGIPEDFETFNTWFQDPKYRQDFHRFLMDQQSQGIVNGIPEAFDQFNAGVTGDPTDEEYMNNNPLFSKGIELPKDFKQMDMGVERVTDQAFDSTETLDDYDDLETYKQTQMDKAMRRFEQEDRQSRFVSQRVQGSLRPRDEGYDQRLENFNKQMRYAEMQYDELMNKLKSGQISENDFKELEKNIWWGDPANTGTEFTKGLVRGVVSVLPSMLSEFLGQFYSDPADFRLNGPSETTLDMRKKFQNAADWFNELGENELISINRNLRTKSLGDVFENPALLPPWIAAKAGETAPSMIPGIAAMKVIRPVSTAGGIIAAATGAAPIEVGAQLQDLRKTGEAEGFVPTEGQKAIAVASGLGSAVFEGIADRYIFTYVSDALRGSNLDEGVKDAIFREVGEQLSRRWTVLLKNTGKQTATESLTETIQQVLNNVGAKYGWDAARSIGEGVPESALIGGVVGGGTTITFGTAANIVAESRQMEAAMERPLLEGTGPFIPVTVSFSNEGGAQGQFQQLQAEKERITAERTQAEKDGRATIDHDLALTQIQLLQSRLAKELNAGRKEAIEFAIQLEENRPSPRQDEESQARRIEATGPRQRVEVETEEGPTSQVITQAPITNPSGKEVKVAAGVAPFAQSIAGLGFEVRSAESGLEIDAQEDGTTAPAQMTLDIRNNAAKTNAVKLAAEDAGFTVSEQDAPALPGIRIELPITRDGSSRADLEREATTLAKQREPALLNDNVVDFIAYRDRIIENELIEDHGGAMALTDDEILNRWENFNQALEKSEGQGPDQRASYEIPAELDQQSQIPVIQRELGKLQENRARAEARGLDVAPIDQAIDELTTRRNDTITELRDQKIEERRLAVAQRGTLQDAMGKPVRLGEYEGTLTTDQEGAVVIETKDGTIVEVPDAGKDLSKPLTELSLERSPGPQRQMELTNPETNEFSFTERDLVTNEVVRSEPMTWLSSNTNPAGEVISVTMQTETGEERTFRDEAIVEAVMWQQYFGSGTQVTTDVTQTEVTPQKQQEFNQALDEIEAGQEDVGFLNSGQDSGAIDVILDKMDAGETLTREEVDEAKLWIGYKLEELGKVKDMDQDEWMMNWQFITVFQDEIADQDDILTYGKSFRNEGQDTPVEPGGLKPVPKDFKMPEPPPKPDQTGINYVSTLDFEDASTLLFRIQNFYDAPRERVRELDERFNNVEKGTPEAQALIDEVAELAVEQGIDDEYVNRMLNQRVAVPLNYPTVDQAQAKKLAQALFMEGKMGENDYKVLLQRLRRSKPGSTASNDAINTITFGAKRKGYSDEAITQFEEKEVVEPNEETIDEEPEEISESESEQPEETTGETEPADRAERNQADVITDGRLAEIRFSAEEVVEGRIAVIEADDLQASNNPDGSLNSMHFISEGQPRDRRGKRYAAQHKSIAQKLVPSMMLNVSGTAFEGTPTTNQYGEVIQGNGRSISMKIAYADHPEKASEYKQELISRATELGLNPKQIEAMDKPVLIRKVEVFDKEAVRLGNLKNRNEAEMDLIESAKSSVRNMDQSKKDELSNRIKNSETENIRALLDEIGPWMIDALPDVSRSEFLNENGDMTVRGKDYLQEVLRSLMFDTTNGRDTMRKFNELPNNIVVGIDKAAGIIIKYLGTPADLSTYLQEAVDIVWNVRKNESMNTASDFVNQGDMFGEASYDQKSIELAQILLDTLEPSTPIMKELGTTGTQKAISKLFRQYEANIDAVPDIFNPNPVPKNTPEGANEAFNITFRQPEQGTPDQETMRSSAVSEDFTETMKSKMSGVSRVAQLEPVGPSDISFISEPMTTKRGKKLEKAFKEDPDGNKVGMKSIIDLFNDMIDVDMRVGNVNTSRRYPANMGKFTRINRTRSPLDDAAFHEGGHAIHFAIQDTDPKFLEQFDWEGFMAPLKDSGLSRASAENEYEYFAEFVRLYVMNPKFTLSTETGKAVIDWLQKNSPGDAAALNDAARLYQLHSARGPVAMFRAANKDTKTAPKPLIEGIKNTFDAFAFNAMGRNWAVENFERDAIWKAFREVYDSKEEADQRAQELLKEIRGTNMDFRIAHQITNRIPGVVKDALSGSGLNIFAPGDGVLATTAQIAKLRAAGMSISQELEASLTDPNAKAGRRINVTGFSIEDVLQKIGKERWPMFENYAQIKVSLERLIMRNAKYPGIKETNPEDLWNEMKDMERANPDFEKRFMELNNYMDKVVLTSVVGGLISADEASAIVSSFDFYLPLPRDVSSRLGSMYGGSSKTPSPDPGFRRLRGDGDFPILPILTAIEQRTYQAVDAFYQNRAMLAPIRMMEHVNSQTDIPLAAKVPINRIVSKLRLDVKKMATMTPMEMAEVVADYLNAETAAENPGMMFDPIKAKDINITTPAKGIWRAVEPNAINVIAPKVNGETVFYQVGDDFMYQYYSRVYEPSKLTKYFETIAKGTEPWKQTLTQSLDFIGRNLPRDVFTNIFLADLPEYTIDDITPAQFVKSTIPGFQLVTGLLAKITGKTAGELVDIELYTNSMYDSLSLERKFMHNAFIEEAKRGVWIDNFKQMSGLQKIAHVGFVAPAWILNKPIHLFLKGIGISKLSTMIEEAPRAGAYMDMLNRGYSQEVAAMAHDHTSGNFGEKPANNLVYQAYRAGGFINPGTQIFSEMVRRITSSDPRIRWQQQTRLGMIGIYTAIAWAISRAMMSDDKEEELLERTEQERRNYMPFGGVYRVPFDYGITGAVQSFVWLSLDKTADEKGLSNTDIAKEVFGRLADTPVSIDSPSGGLSSVMQMMFGPQLTGGAEAIFNYKLFWEEPIVPPFLAANYSPAQQAYATTPGFYKTLGELSGTSPLKVQHVLNNATGYLFDRALRMASKIESGEGIDATDLPLGGKLVVDKPTGWRTLSAQSISEVNQKYLDLKRKRDQIMDQRQRTPKEIEEARALDLELRRLSYYHSAANSLDSMYGAIRDARDRGEFEKANELSDRMTATAASLLARAKIVSGE